MAPGRRGRAGLALAALAAAGLALIAARAAERGGGAADGPPAPPAPAADSAAARLERTFARLRLAGMRATRLALELRRELDARAATVVPARSETREPAPPAPVRILPAQAPREPDAEPAAAAATGGARAAAAPVVAEANPTNLTVELIIGLRLGERYLGEVPVRITPDDVVSFAAEDLLRPLRAILDPALVQALEQAADGAGRLTLAAANAAGLATAYDPGLLELAVSIPAAQRGEQVISLRGEPAAPGDLAQESRVAAFLTARANLDYVSESVDGEEGREPLRIDLESGIRLFGAAGFAVLAEGDFEEDGMRPFARDHTRLVYDRPDDAWRFTAGDLDFEVAELQASDDILGLSFEQTFDLQPRRSTRPAGRQQFVLEREATVDVVVNGVTVRTFRLDPGRYDIRDFPFTAGSNDVQLIVEDAFGRRELLDFSTSFANDLLEVGLAEFSYALGIASEVEDREREYAAGAPVASFFHRLGVLESLTLGVNAQGSADQQQAGGEVVWALPLGNFGVNLAASRVDDVGWDVGLAFDYEHPFQDAPSSRRLTMSADYAGRRFAAMGDLDPDNDVVVDLDVDYSEDLAWNLRGSASASYAVGRGGTADQRSLSLSLSRTLGDLTLGLQTLYQQEQGRDPDLDLLVTGTWRLTADQRIGLRHDTKGHRTRLDYDVVGASAVGGVGGTLSLEHAADDDRVDVLGSVDYIGNRFEADASHDLLMTDLDDTDAREQRTSLTLESSLAFAGGRLALGRPIDAEGSFAIVYPHRSLAGRRVAVNPSRDGADAVADRLGPAVVDAQPYGEETVEIEVAELPVGYDLGAGRYGLRPSLASGYALEVGSAASVSVLGTLLDPSGMPVALMGGQAIDLDDPQAPPVTVLSNSVGRFAAQPLKPGRYRIRMFTTPPLVAEIAVGEDAIGLVDVGTLTLQRE